MKISRYCDWAARLFMMPEDLSHFEVAVPKILKTSVADKHAAILPCAMTKYPEARDALIASMQLKSKFDASAWFGCVEKSLEAHHSLPCARRAHLHHSLYVHGGQAPGGFASKLHLHAGLQVS